MVAPLRLGRVLPPGLPLAVLALTFGPVLYLDLVAGTENSPLFIVLYLIGGVNFVRIMVADHRDSRDGRRGSIAGRQLLVAAAAWVAPIWYALLTWQFRSREAPTGCNRDLFMACASPAEGGLFVAVIFYPFSFVVGWVLMEVLHARRPQP